MDKLFEYFPEMIWDIGSFTRYIYFQDKLEYGVVA